MAYIIRRIPKASGAFRTIEEPDPELKIEQRELLRELSRFEFPPHVTCATGRGLPDNVAPHMGKELILTMDVSNFFGSVKPAMVQRGALEIGSRVQLWFVQNRERIREKCFNQNPLGGPFYLPQGAPTSPFLANVAALTMDSYILSKLPPGWDYTRYMDDMTISVDDFVDLRPTISMVDDTAETIGLQINKKKTKILYRDREQVVTGITMNSSYKRPTIKRSRKRKLRAQLDHLAREGKMTPEVQGYLAFLRGVDPELHGKMVRHYQKRLAIHQI